MIAYQNDIFSELYPKFTITKPIRLIELFAGIGAQAKALENLGIEFEHWKAVEIDRFAMASYNAIHGTNFETSDITKIHAEDLEIVERDKYCYILTYSFPCQDLSLAGLQKGMAKGSGTRSGLLWEVERILDECNGNLPQVLLMENVTQVISKKHIADFYAWRGKLETRLKDVLEKDVDEKYYLSEKAQKTVLKGGTKNYYMKPEIDLDTARPLTATMHKMHRAGTDNYVSDGFIKNGERYLIDGNSDVIGGGYLKIPEKTRKGYAIAEDGDGVYINRPHQKRGTVQKGMVQTIKTNLDVGVVVKGDEE